MNFYVLTIFPDMIQSGINHSIIKRAIEKNIVNIVPVDIREFSTNKHKKVDDYPYGGGAGMVMSAEPIYNAFSSIREKIKSDTKVVYLTPQGKVFNQKLAQQFSQYEDIVLLSGHYEGIDERVIEEIVTDEISIGDFVLTGGELAAMVIIDSVSRLIKGVLGNENSFVDESFSSDYLEYPHYTRPREFLGKKVPDILLSGHHKKIEMWRHEQSLLRTRLKRPELLNKKRCENDMVLENLEPSKVFKYFEVISNIPRSSGHEKEISDYICNFAKERNLQFIQDKSLNVFIKKPATKGYENAKAVILQGHLDMVCEKNMGTEHDFLKDPLKLYIEDGFIKAKGTTLGADNGIAVAMVLALLDSDDVKHPNLEIVLTTEEETGLTGAATFDTSILTGKYFINIDSEEEGEFLGSCAGGVRVNLSIPIEKTKPQANFVEYNIVVKGLLGGHSGIMIDKYRANSIVLMGRILDRIISEFEINIAHIFGGSKDNAIPRESLASIYIKDVDVDKIKNIIEDLEKTFKNEFLNIDNDLKLYFEKKENNYEDVLTITSTEKIISALVMLPNGVMTMCQELEGLVRTSNNLGVLETFEDKVIIKSALRSSVETQKQMMINKFERMAKILGGSITLYGDYPGWEFKANSEIRQIFLDTYKEMFGKEGTVKAVHAGLECGIFLKSIDVDAISFGPDIYNAHNPMEKMCINSVKNNYELLLKVLELLK